MTRNGLLMKKIMEHIESKEMIVTGDIQDLMMIMHILNEHRTLFQMDKIWTHIEAVAMLQCFTEELRKHAPPQALAEIICLYAFEFSRSSAKFDKFFDKFFSYIKEDKETLKNLNVMGIAHVCIALAQFGHIGDDY